MVESDPLLTREKIEELARQWFREAVEEDERLIAGTRFDDESELEAAIGRAARFAEGSRELLRINDVGAASEDAAAALRDSGLTAARDAPEYQLLCRMILRAANAVAEVRTARLAGDYKTQPSDPFFAAADQPIVDQRTQPSRRAVPPFSQIVKSYVAEKMRQHEWRAQTEHQNRKTFQLATECLGDRPINRYQRADASRFCQTIQKLPAKYGQAAAFKGKSLNELVALTSDVLSKIDLISSRTVERHMIALSGLFDWAKRQGHIDGENPVSGVFRYKRSKRARDERAAWSADQLAILFSSPLWQGAKSETRRSELGKVIKRDALFWTPLIAVHSGMRLEEICSLRVSDLQQATGIWFFDVTPDGGKLLKSLAATRRVPVHRDLIALGFLNYLHRQSERGKGRLFPELTTGGADGRFGFYVTKKFGRYVAKIGIAGVDFHGFRHTVRTALQQSGVPEPIINEVMGHEAGGGEGGRYGKGYRLDQLRDAIDNIAYPGLDIVQRLKNAP